MIKLLAIICLCLSLSIVSTQSCTPTDALRNKYGLSNTKSTASNEVGVKYCNSIKTSAVCCTAADMNTLQAKSDALISNLTNTVITRDQYFKSVNNDPVGRLNTATTNFATTTTNLGNYISQQSVSNPSAVTQLQGISSILNGVSGGNAQIIAALNSVQTNLKAFQAARTNCVVEIVKLQNSALCLSCDPNATSKGYNTDTDTITLGPTACNRLKAACYPFVSTSFFQNGPILIQEVINTMDLFNTLVARIINGQTVPASSFVYNSPNPPSAHIPTTCTTQANCDWICTGLFNGGVINRIDLTAGAQTEGNNSGGRLLMEDAPKRILDNGSTFDPAEDEADVTVTFQDDPGNINNNNAAQSGVLSFGSVFVGTMIILLSYFF